MSKKYAGLFSVLAVALALFATPVAAFAATGVGDVSSAMRYGASAPLGSIISGLSGTDDDVEVLTPAFSINFFGTVYDRICVTTNGGIYPQSEGDPDCSNRFDRDLENLALRSDAPIIAALGADVDLTECDGDAARVAASAYRGAGTGDGFGIPCEMYYGATTVDGRDAYAVTWYRVSHNDDENDADLFNTFQIVITKTADWNGTTNHDFDIEFNFGTVQDYDDGYSAADGSSTCSSTETGSSDCRWGIGWADYSAGPPETADSSELFPNTAAVDLADGGVTSLTANSLNSSVAGRYTFGQRGGVTTSFSVPTLDGSAAGLNSSSSEGPAGVPGIYLAVAGPVGRSVWESPVYYGSDRVAASSTYVLTVAAVPSNSRSKVSLAEGELPLNGSLQAMVRLPVLAPGTYNVRMEGTHKNGSTLQLTSVITVGPSGKFTSIGPNIPVIK